jgi:hypothetical protein
MHDRAPTSDIVATWPRTNAESQAHLVQLLEGARERITVFGLTRNFYASDTLRPLLKRKSREVPIVLFMMAPDCASRADRYRIEPADAALGDPSTYRREVERSFLELVREAPTTTAGSSTPGLALYYYDFPCSFAIEEVDDEIRVMLYGHGVRGTDGPILLMHRGSEMAEYFVQQLRWMERLALGEPWTVAAAKGVVVRRVSPLP